MKQLGATPLNDISKTDDLNDLLIPPQDVESGWYQKRGRAFERVIKKVLAEQGHEPRGSWKPKGEEIDGSFVYNGNTYLLEAKWHKEPLPASSIYSFRGKVDGKLIGTIGIFISMSGFSEECVNALIFGKNLNVILFGAKDFTLIHNKQISFANAMKAKLRYAVEEGQPYLPLASDESKPVEEETDWNPDVHRMKTISRNNGVWNILVASEADEIGLKNIFERLNIARLVRFWPAGSKQNIPSLARTFNKDESNLVAIIGSNGITDDLKEEIDEIFNGNLNDRIIIPYEVEDWMEMACPNEYIMAVPPTSIRNKAARRFSTHADLDELLRSNKDFSDLILRISGTEK
ncbi:TPA: restriction endonuclease [Klebsiella oxytoca]|uniref:restriction endonuclease n=1 Tax=Klebsiella oxytoca TaxID=571 RepID=UPI0013271F5A|nr:restriction endonuclease [Klebsiella oxytoca]MXS11862.1 hypothetical protein [Klebsiella oxytoca]HCK6977309.1 restriction endonuclease [Klebsiella oxytoca]HCK6989068.1 restriction endonuclease [Klebsiella oxytoca]